MPYNRKRFGPATNGRRAKMRKLCKDDKQRDTEKQAGVSRKQSLRSYGAVINDDGGGRGDSHRVQDDEEGKLHSSTEHFSQDSEGPDFLEAEARLLKNVQELNKYLEEISEIFENFRQLSAAVGCAGSSQGKGPDGDNAVKRAPLNYAFCNIVRGNAENEAGNIISGDQKYDDEVVEIHLPDDEEERTCEKCQPYSHLEQSSDPPSIHSQPTPSGENDDRPFSYAFSPDGLVPEPHVLISESGTEAQDEQKSIQTDLVIKNCEEVEQEEKKVVNTAPEMKQSSSEQHLHAIELTVQQRVGGSPFSAAAVAAELITRKPLAVKQKRGAWSTQFRKGRKRWSTRFRKDGKRWSRKGHTTFTHIKRKNLVYARCREARSANVKTNIQNLLRKETRKEEAGFPGDSSDGEILSYETYCPIPPIDKAASDEDRDYGKTSYVPYTPRSNRAASNDHPDNEQLEDLFKQMAFAMDKGWEGRKSTDKNITKQNRTCIHSCVFEDDVGMYCEKCGLVTETIEKIFLMDPSAAHSKKKAAVVPVEEQVDPDNKDQHSEGLLISQDELPRVTLALHPFYEERLHPHQKEGISFLAQNLIGDKHRRLAPGGCILAHAPGTGKSCLTVSFVQSFLNAYPKGRPMIVAPKIMLKPWQKEFDQWNVQDIPTYNLNETFSNGKKKSSWKGSGDLASVVSASAHFKERAESSRIKLIKKWLEDSSVLLLSYNLFAILVLAGLNDKNTGSVKQQICQALLDGPELLILDEGHFPRTKRTKISQALMRVRTKRKILLSGTLFQNNFKELFNLLKLARHDFMSVSAEFATRLKLIAKKKPSFDMDVDHFAGRTSNELNLAVRECEEQMFMEHIGCKLDDFIEGVDNFEEINMVLQKLRALTSPMVHWYTGQILKSLPGLCEFVVYLNLTASQQKLYSTLACKGSFEEKIRIAEVCIHPALLKYEDNLEQSLTAPNTAYSADQEYSDGVKTDFIFNLLRLCQIYGERLLVFCQTLSPLALIENMLVNVRGWSRGTEILRLDGTMQSDERQCTIDRFNDGSSKACIMLASITACKEGISLVGASRVVILDVLYNPSVVRQAVSRAFRIGQKKRVHVYRLVAADTKEEKIFQAAVQKDWFSRVLMDQSLTEKSSGSSFHAENILQVDESPDDNILQKMLRDDEAKRVNRVCRYRTHFSKF